MAMHELTLGPGALLRILADPGSPVTLIGEPFCFVVLKEQHEKDIHPCWGSPKEEHPPRSRTHDFEIRAAVLFNVPANFLRFGQAAPSVEERVPVGQLHPVDPKLHGEVSPLSIIPLSVFFFFFWGGVVEEVIATRKWWPPKKDASGGAQDWYSCRCGVNRGHHQEGCSLGDPLF